MSSGSDRPRILTALGILTALLVSACAQSSVVAPPLMYTRGAVTNISGSCKGQNAEVEQAVDAARGYVYEEWIGCSGIGFARSIDGGRHPLCPGPLARTYMFGIRRWRSPRTATCMRRS
jgi:hypothetical protein